MPDNSHRQAHKVAQMKMTQQEAMLASEKLGGMDITNDSPEGFATAAEMLTPYGDAKAIYDWFKEDKTMAGTLFAILSMIGVPDEALKTIKSVRTFNTKSSGGARFKDAHVFVNPSKYDVERAEIGIRKLARQENLEQYQGDKIVWRGVLDKEKDTRYIWPAHEALHDDVVKYLGVEEGLIDSSTLMFSERGVTAAETAKLGERYATFDSDSLDWEKQLRSF